MWGAIAVFLVSWFFLALISDRFSHNERSVFRDSQPLLLTPLLEINKISEAKKLCRVTPDFLDTTSYSGYFTVNKECESNLFFWFFPAQNNWESAPVVLWVQGGPAASSLSSLFGTIGPLTYHRDFGLGKRQYSWNFESNLLFVDQPVGTGFSFTGKECYAQNITRVGIEFHSAVVQFFQLFPELIMNKFFIAGQSYAGHFIPVLGHMIHKTNPSSKAKINLKGMIIGNGLMDTFHQSDYGSLLHQLGLVDDLGRDAFHKLQKEYHNCLKNEEWDKALLLFYDLIDNTYKTYVGNVSIYNYLKKSLSSIQPYEPFLQLIETRKAIHVGNTTFSPMSADAAKSLGVDPVLSVKHLVEELLEYYTVVFYTGQLDIITGYPLVVNFLKALDWSGKVSFENASRQKWCVEDEQAGYVKSAHNLYEVMVRNAGHIVPEDQPHWMYVLINSIITGPEDNFFQKLQMC